MRLLDRLKCTISMMTNGETELALLLAALDAQMVLSVRESPAGLRARIFCTPSIKQLFTLHGYKEFLYLKTIHPEGRESQAYRR